MSCELTLPTKVTLKSAKCDAGDKLVLSDSDRVPENRQFYRMAGFGELGPGVHPLDDIATAVGVAAEEEVRAKRKRRTELEGEMEECKKAKFHIAQEISEEKSELNETENKLSDVTDRMEVRKVQVFHIDRNIKSVAEEKARISRKMRSPDIDYKRMDFKMKRLAEEKAKEEEEYKSDRKIERALQNKQFRRATRLQYEEERFEAAKGKIEEVARELAGLAGAPGYSLSELRQVEARLATMVAGLECPVCWSTCCPPIYTCRRQHLVCAACRPRLLRCGQCRSHYTGMELHRYNRTS